MLLPSPHDHTRLSVFFFFFYAAVEGTFGELLARMSNTNTGSPRRRRNTIRLLHHSGLGHVNLGEGIVEGIWTALEKIDVDVVSSATVIECQ